MSMNSSRCFTSLNFFHRTLLNKNPEDAVHNAQFLRPLYAIAAVGPICLLDAEQISAKSKGGWSTVHLTQASVMGLKKTCLEKLAIEADLLNLILDAATEGPDIIHPRLDRLVLKWSESLGLIDPSPDNCLSGSISRSIDRSSLPPKSEAVDHQRVIRQALQRALSKPIRPNALSDAVKDEMKDVMDLLPTSASGQPLPGGHFEDAVAPRPKTDWVASYGSATDPAAASVEVKLLDNIHAPTSRNSATPAHESNSNESHNTRISNVLLDTPPSLPSSLSYSREDTDSDKKRKRIARSAASDDELQSPSKKEKVVSASGCYKRNNSYVNVLGSVRERRPRLDERHHHRKCIFLQCGWVETDSRYSLRRVGDFLPTT